MQAKTPPLGALLLSLSPRRVALGRPGLMRCLIGHVALRKKDYFRAPVPAESLPAARSMTALCKKLPCVARKLACMYLSLIQGCVTVSEKVMLQLNLHQHSDKQACRLCASPLDHRQQQSKLL